MFFLFFFVFRADNLKFENLYNSISSFFLSSLKGKQVKYPSYINQSSKIFSESSYLSTSFD